MWSILSPRKLVPAKINSNMVASLEPASFELSKLYHRDVQSLTRLAQLNVNI